MTCFQRSGGCWGGGGGTHSPSSPCDSQPTYRLWRLLRARGEVAAAAGAREALVRMWGEDQLAWYSTDVDGDVVKYIDTAGKSRVDAQLQRSYF